MISKVYPYSLAKKGKWKCPECGRKTFVCYVDTDGNILDESVGKCDRANNCGYHKPPKEYFEECKNNGVEVPRHHARPIFKQEPTASFIDNSDDGPFKKSLKHYDRNHLITFLSGVFGVARSTK